MNLFSVSSAGYNCCLLLSIQHVVSNLHFFCEVKQAFKQNFKLVMIYEFSEHNIFIRAAKLV